MPIPGLINPLNRNQGLPPNQNLINQVPYESIVRPSGYYLSLVLDSICVVLAVLTSWFYSRYLSGQSSVWLPVAGSGAFVLAGMFPLLLTKSFSRRMVVLLLEVVGLLSFFWREPFLFLLPVAAAAYAFLLWGDWFSRREQKNAVQVRFARMTREYSNKSITALTMVAVLLFLPQWQAEQGFLSRDNFQSLYDSSSGFVTQFYQELELDSTFGDFAHSFVRLQFAGNLAYEQLLPPAKAKALDEGKTQFIRDLEQSWGMQVPQDKLLSTVAYEYLIRQFETWRGTFGERFLAAWAIVVFFLVRSLGYFFSIVVGAAGYFVFQLILALNAVHIRGESVMREEIDYS